MEQEPQIEQIDQQQINEPSSNEVYSIFLDISGSVNGSENYWNTVKDIF